jgi:opacity protein-like surface antigen
MKSLCALWLVSSPLLFAQPVQFGVKGGVSFSDAVRIGVDESRAYTVGPMLEFRLPAGFAIETGLQYKRLGASGEIVFEGDQYLFRTRGHSLELPILVKYYFRPGGGWSPYASGGVAVRRSFQTADGSAFGSAISRRLYDLSPSGVGPVVAGGVQFRLGPLKVGPEIRFTHWNEENERIPRNANQLELMVGLSF